MMTQSVLCITNRPRVCSSFGSSIRLPHRIYFVLLQAEANSSISTLLAASNSSTFKFMATSKWRHSFVKLALRCSDWGRVIAIAWDWSSAPTLFEFVEFHIEWLFIADRSLMASTFSCGEFRLVKLVIHLLLPVTALLALLQVQTTESVDIPFGATYSASTDPSHTRVEGGGSRVDLVLDHSSGQRGSLSSEIPHCKLEVNNYQPGL